MVFFTHPEQAIRVKTISIFAQLLIRHEFDKRYQASRCRKRIASLYFPFIVLVSENIESFKSKMEFGDKRLTFICILWVLKNLSKQILKQWWKLEEKEKLLQFFEVLIQSLKIFEYVGRDELELRIGKTKNVIQSSVLFFFYFFFFIYFSFSISLFLFIYLFFLFFLYFFFFSISLFLFIYLFFFFFIYFSFLSLFIFFISFLFILLLTYLIYLKY